MPCVTFSRAKVRPPYPDSYWRPVDRRGGRFFGSELVCTIPRDTSEDSARTSPAFWRDLEDWTHQRHALERPETQRNHHCPGNKCRQWQLSRGEKFWSADRFLFSFLEAACDQRGVARQPEGSLAAKR